MNHGFLPSQATYGKDYKNDPDINKSDLVIDKTDPIINKHSQE